MHMWPGVWPGVGIVVRSAVSRCSPSMNSTRPRSASGHTQVGALGKRCGCTSGWPEPSGHPGVALGDVDFGRRLEEGLFYVGNTIEELAGQIDVDSATLAETTPAAGWFNRKSFVRAI